MKKILLFTESLGSGGAERQLVNLAVLLKEKGYEVKVITYLRNQFYEPILIKNGIVYELHEELLSLHTRIPRLIKLLRKEQTDVVISYLPSPNISMCIVRNFLKFKLIVSERSFTTLNFNTKLKLYLYRNADYVVANSVCEFENLRDLSPKLNNKLLYIHNYIDLNKFDHIKKDVINDNWEKRPVNIVVVGRVIPVKNPSGMIEAFKILKSRGINAKIHWYGNTEINQPYFEKLKNRLVELNLNQDFIFHGQINDVIEAYKMADIVCLPSLIEGFPNAICEAMSCGLPIISTDVSDASFLVENEKNGYIIPVNDNIALADALINMINMPYNEFVGMCYHSKERAKAIFSKETFLNKYLSLIES